MRVVEVDYAINHRKLAHPLEEDQTIKIPVVFTRLLSSVSKQAQIYELILLLNSIQLSRTLYLQSFFSFSLSSECDHPIKTYIFFSAMLLLLYQQLQTTTNCQMYNRSLFPTTPLKFYKSRSTANHQLRSQRSLNLQTYPREPKDQCIACHHQKSHQSKFKTFMTASKSKLRTSNNEEYYATEDKQTTNLRKAKRFLQDMLQKNRNQLRKNTENYEKKLSVLTLELQQKTQQLTQLYISFNHLQAQKQYHANVSLVRSYNDTNTNNEDEQQFKNRKIKELSKKNALLQQQLTQKQQQLETQRVSMEKAEQKLQKMKDYQYYAQEYEAMKGLITKMEIEKLELLDKHQEEIEFIETKYKEEVSSYQAKIVHFRQVNQNKSKEIELLDTQLKSIKTQLNSFKSKQFTTFKELLDQKEKECQALESKITCIESQVNFLKGRFGYILKLAKNDQLNDPNQNEEYCIEKIGRFNISAGKQSLLGMNLSPIRRR